MFHLQIGSISERGWGCIVAYFCTHGRRGIFVKVAGTRGRLPSGGDSLPQQDASDHGSSTQSILEACPIQGACELQYGEAECSKYSSRKSQDGYTTSIKQLRRQKGAKILADKVMQMLTRYPTSPLSQICDTKEWLFDEDLQYIRADNKMFINALDTFTKRLCTFNMRDFSNFYDDTECYPKFSCGPASYTDIYYDITASLTIIERLMNYQFGEDAVAIDYFLRTLYKVLERKIPKLNTICLIGPASSGKSYFIDMICNFLLNVGRMGTLNRFNQFGLMDTSGKRIIVWDEPNYERARLEDLKKILGGGEHKVSTKFKGDQAVYRTPVIITTNNNIGIITDPNFNDRMRTFQWTACPFLKECDKLPSPLTTISMFKHFNIIDNNFEYIE